MMKKKINIQNDIMSRVGISRGIFSPIQAPVPVETKLQDTDAQSEDVPGEAPDAIPVREEEPKKGRRTPKGNF